MSDWVYRHRIGLIAWIGALMVYFALEQGIGFDLGWWSFLFWSGTGVLWAAVRHKRAS